MRFASEERRADEVVAEVFVSMANTEGGVVVLVKLFAAHAEAGIQHPWQMPADCIVRASMPEWSGQNCLTAQSQENWRFRSQFFASRDSQIWQVCHI